MIRFWLLLHFWPFFFGNSFVWMWSTSILFYFMDRVHKWSLLSVALFCVISFIDDVGGRGEVRRAFGLCCFFHFCRILNFSLFISLFHLLPHCSGLITFFKKNIFHFPPKAELLSGCHFWSCSFLIFPWELPRLTLCSSVLGVALYVLHLSPLYPSVSFLGAS